MSICNVERDPTGQVDPFTDTWLHDTAVSRITARFGLVVGILSVQDLPGQATGPLGSFVSTSRLNKLLPSAEKGDVENALNNT